VSSQPRCRAKRYFGPGGRPVFNRLERTRTRVLRLPFGTKGTSSPDQFLQCEGRPRECTHCSNASNGRAGSFPGVGGISNRIVVAKSRLTRILSSGSPRRDHHSGVAASRSSRLRESSLSRLVPSPGRGSGCSDQIASGTKHAFQQQLQRAFFVNRSPTGPALNKQRRER